MTQLISHIPIADLDERISQVEKALKQVDQTVSKDLQLPDGWSVNGSNEVRYRKQTLRLHLTAASLH